MFTSKAVEKLLGNQDLEALIVESALKPIGLPPEVESIFTEELCADDGNIDDAIKIKDPTKKKKARKGYAPRESIPRAPKEASAWYLRYLAANKRNEIKRGESDPEASPAEIKLAKQFKSTFRVYFSVFQEIKELIVDRRFHDPNKKDALGFSHDLALLVLGLLFYAGWDTTFDFIGTNTEIAGEVHRTFHHKICSEFKEIKDEFVYLPRNEAELDPVISQYASYGFPGCVGSIDVVHIAWGNCPQVVIAKCTTPTFFYPFLRARSTARAGASARNKRKFSNKVLYSYSTKVGLHLHVH